MLKISLKNWQSIILFFLATFQFNCYAEFVVSYRTGDSNHDQRQDYSHDVITLLMEKTVKEFGPYRMLPTPVMNSVREIFALSTNAYPNFVAEISYTDKTFEDKKLDFIPIPVDFGIVGYRVCFVNPKKKAEIANITSLHELQNYRIGQGVGWPDTIILQRNGLKVIEENNYDSLFKLVASGRIDLFCRGVNELPYELNAFRYIEQLTYDESFVFYYPLPRFLSFERSATELKQRLLLGLQKTLDDGSLKKLWLKHFQKNIEFLHLNKRKVYNLENSTIQHLDQDYKKYNIDPFKL